MDHSGTGVIAIKAVQELKKENEKLLAQLQNVNSVNVDLENRIQLLEQQIKLLSKSVEHLTKQ